MIVVPFATPGLQAQLPPEAVEALEAATAASVDLQLQRYRSHLLAAQQQLLARELGEGGHHSSAAAHMQAGTCRQLGQLLEEGGTACSNPDSTSSDAYAAGVKSAAELTMQQLVVRLAQLDVQPDATDSPPATCM